MKFVAGPRVRLEDLPRPLGTDDKVPVLHPLLDQLVLDDVLQLNRRVANDPQLLDPQPQREHVRNVGRVRLALYALSLPMKSIVHSRVSRLTCDSSHSSILMMTH